MIEIYLPSNSYVNDFSSKKNSEKLKIIELGLSLFNSGKDIIQFWNNDEWESKIKSLETEIKTKEASFLGEKTQIINKIRQEEEGKDLVEKAPVDPRPKEVIRQRISGRRPIIGWREKEIQVFEFQIELSPAQAHIQKEIQQGEITEPLPLLIVEYIGIGVICPHAVIAEPSEGQTRLHLQHTIEQVELHMQTLSGVDARKP